MRKRLGQQPTNFAVSVTCLSVALLLVGPGAALGVPEITNLSLRGLQAGGTTTLTIEGSDLLPEPRLLLSAPIASQAVKPGATANKVQIEVKLADTTSVGLYQLRVANAKGISNPILISIDTLPQLPFAAKLEKLPAALHGAVVENETLRTAFAGKAGQRIVVDAEAKRLGAAIDPIVVLNDPRGVQIAWAQGVTTLGGDARLEAALPADGEYSVELRDALYKAPSPNFFRLKIGELRYADLTFPLGARRGTKASLELIGNFSAETRTPVDLTGALGDVAAILPRMPGLTSPVPRIMVNDLPEVMEAAPPKGKLQEIAVPAIINGRIGSPGEEDRYRLLVKPGMQLHFEVFANRLGSPLDGVLSLREESGAELVSNDDRPDTVDPSVDFQITAEMKTAVLSLRDVAGRGGPNFVYRIVIEPSERPDFRLTLLQDRAHIPQAGYGIVHVRADRAGYGGPIRLLIPGLPDGVAMSSSEIPPGATDTLLTLHAPAGWEPAQVLAHIVGESDDPNLALRRLARVPETPVTRNSPWLRSELAVAVTPPGPISIVWDTADATLPIGGTYSAKVRVSRAPGVMGPIRLSLLTGQQVPRLPDGREDTNRALRIDGAPTIPGDKSDGTAVLIVPANLPAQRYHVALRAELLAIDGRTVIASAVTPSRRLSALKPPPPPAPPKPKK